MSFNPADIGLSLSDRAVDEKNLLVYLNRELGPLARRMSDSYRAFEAFLRSGTKGQVVTAVGDETIEWGAPFWPVVHVGPDPGTTLLTAYTRVLVADGSLGIGLELPAEPNDGDAIDVFAWSAPSDGNLAVYGNGHQIVGRAVTGGNIDDNWSAWEVKRYTFDSVLGYWRQS